MTDIALLLPVLNRPQRAAAVVDSIRAASAEEHRILFLCSPGDTAEIEACLATDADVLVVDWEPRSGDWARKLEYGRELTTEPYMLLGADDLRFHTGWDVNALRHFETTDCGVLGTQDGGNELVKRGLHSTHPMVRRAYIDSCGTIDEPERMLHFGYDHQFADNELCETAMARGCWLFGWDVVVEHMHPNWNKAEEDATYKKGARWAVRDQMHFTKRRALWGGPPQESRQRGRLPRANPARGQTGVITPSARYGQIAHRRVGS